MVAKIYLIKIIRENHKKYIHEDDNYILRRLDLMPSALCEKKVIETKKKKKEAQIDGKNFYSGRNEIQLN